jgi:von Willebrand factor type A domain
MRQFAFLSAVVLLPLILACSGPSTDSDPNHTPVAWGRDVPQSTELAGQDVETETSGPWTVRKTSSGRTGGRGGRGGGGGGSDALMLKAEMEMDELTDAPSEGGPPVGAAAVPTSPGHDGGGAAAKAMDPSDSLEADDKASLEPSPVSKSRPGMVTGSPQNAGPLKAATTDDNVDFEEFLKFMAGWGDREDTAGIYDELDVADRVYIQVSNEAGKLVPAARVSVVDVERDRVALVGTTYGDGRVPFYPHLEADPNVAASTAPDRYLVEVMAGTARQKVRWDGRSDLAVTVSVPQPVTDPIALDVLFLIDTTGSMGDEIERIKNSLLSMTEKLRSMEREFDLRYAAVLYRDIGDEYVTKAHPFTGDIKAFDAALATIRADGGGDGPESLNQGLAEAVGRADWRDGAAKVMFLIADASPHMDYAGDVPYGESLKAALAAGIRIHSVAASGIDPVGSLAFRQIAQFTRGKFIFIEYGSTAKSAATHGVTGKVKSNNLDDILFEQIREEVARWGRPSSD